jgi:hypothetical protein
LRLDWDRIIAAWALVLVLILGAAAVADLVHSSRITQAIPALHGAKIPQHDPFNLGPPAFEDDDPAAGEAAPVP